MSSKLFFQTSNIIASYSVSKHILNFMIHKNLALLSCVFFFLVSGLCFSQKAILQGKITDEKGEALAFATLHLKNTTIGTTTNAEGTYSLQVAIGNYEVIAQYPGQKSITQQISVTEVKTYLLNFVLPSEEEIQAITVQAKAVNYADEVIRNAKKIEKNTWKSVPTTNAMCM